MQPRENDELTDPELDAILPAWKSLAAPARLRAAVFPDVPTAWWRRPWHASIRIPLPVACGLAVLLALAAWQWFTPRTVYRDRVTPASAVTGTDPSALRPVLELRPRIIRSKNVQN